MSAGADLRGAPQPAPTALPGAVAVSATPRRRLRSLVPRPLAALLVVVALFGVTWALLVPAWLAPDEDVHFSYVESLVERGELPGRGPAALSPAQLGSAFATNTDPVVFFPYAQPELSRPAYEAWLRRTERESQTQGGGPNAATAYPPGFYLSATLGYRLAGDGNPLDHLYAARLLSVLWLLVTTTATWLLAGELLGRRRGLQLVAAGVVGLWPMLVFLSSSVNPDAMLYATWSLTLWLGVSAIRNGLTVPRAIGFGLAVGLALVTKATSLAILPAVAFVLGLLAWRALRSRTARRGLPLVGLAAAVGALAPVAWQIAQRTLERGPAYGQSYTISAGINIREFLTYVWQFYLPRLPFQTPFELSPQGITGLPAADVWVSTGWAAFGWVSLYFRPWAYWLFLAITLLVAAAVLAGGAGALARHRASPALRARGLPIALFLGLAATALVGGLHLNEYVLRFSVNQGRYLFPLAALGGVAVAYAVGLAPKRARPALTGGVLAALVVFQLACLGLVGSTYYA